MKDNNLISVIVPVYNTEKYLEKCINSIINQTYNNLEIILVDDGSTDKSGFICDKYANEDSRIKVIHKENNGVSSARNDGIKCARGKFIGFVDSDDYIENDMFEILIKNKYKYNVDLSMCNYNIIAKNKKFIRNFSNFENVLFINNKKNFYNLLNENYYKGFLVNKLFEAEKIKKIYLDTSIHICEDLLLVVKYAELCNSFCFDSRGVYNYVQRENSALHMHVKEKNITAIKAYDYIIDVIAKYDINLCNQYKLTQSFWLSDIIRNCNKAELNTKMKKLYRELMKSDIGFKNKIKLFVRYKLYYFYNFIRIIYHKLKY